MNLVAPSTREGQLLKTLIEKLERIRQQMKSDKVNNSIGRILAAASIKQYMEMAILGDPEAIARELDDCLTKEQVQALAERERRLYGDGGDV